MIGRMEYWKSGRGMEGWKRGRGWKRGKMEGWKRVEGWMWLNKEAQSRMNVLQKRHNLTECATTSQCFCFVKEAWDVV